MKAELANQWVEAMESGKYKQGKDKLKTDNGMCCLGVLLDILFPNDWESPIEVAPEETKRGYTNTKNRRYQLSDDLYLSDDVCLLVGLTQDQQRALSSINDRSDDYMRSIEWIKENLLEQQI
jgi:hypothetical protein